MIEARRPYVFPLIIVLFALLSFGRIWLIRDVIWDDNCWLLSLYATSTLTEFLNTGPVELRRELFSIFLYYLLALHKATDYFFIAWHAINMVTQIISPLVLYLFVSNLFNRPVPAFFIAISLIVFPLDHTVPYVSAINYRLSLLLSIVSFYLTGKSLAQDRVRVGSLLLALGLSAISYYVFMEASIALEPARLLIIGYLLYRRGYGRDLAVKKAVYYWSPFFFLTIPLVVYKLRYKPYGMYEGMYATNPLFFLDVKRLFFNVAGPAYFQWKALVEDIDHTNAGSIVMGIGAIILGFVLFKRRSLSNNDEFIRRHACSDKVLKNALAKHWNSERLFLLFGVAFSVPPACLFMYAQLALYGSHMNSSHAALLQIGFAFLAGTLLFIVYSVSRSLPRMETIGRWCMALLLGLGVFMTNKHLDLYFYSWEQQTQFWQSFTQRFPRLPEKAVFFFDVQDDAYVSDLRNYYDFEFQLNLLYARSAAPEQFHKYSVYTMEDFARNSKHLANEKLIQRPTHLGPEVLNPREFIVVRYRNDELLVNREIAERYPDIAYKPWLDKDVPLLPEPVFYVFRHKLEEPI